jgi:hypothetical protein
VDVLGERNERLFLTLGQAAKRVGKSKATISKAIADGKLSVYERSSDGFKIDPAELFRVFAPKNLANTRNDQSERTSEQCEHRQVKSSNTEIAVLKAKLEAAEQRLNDQNRLIEDYRQRLDKEFEERQRLITFLLPSPTPAEKSKKRSWWRWYWRGEA